MGGVYLPVSLSALSSTFAGLRLNTAHRSQNSSTVGLPCLPSLRSRIRAGLTPIARLMARYEIGLSAVSRASKMIRMTVVSRSHHSLFGLGMNKGYRMSQISDTPNVDPLDKMLENSIIKNMMENTNTMTTSQTAIELLRRICASKDITQQVLATRLGVNRTTVAYRFANLSMDLESFCNTAQALNENPGHVLTQAIHIHQATQAPALAGGEVE